MTVLGITGGVGAGKSEVLAYLSEKYGACIVRLDDVSRELLSEGGACVKDAVRLFGDEIVLPDGTLSRQKIAERIFCCERLRLALDAIIHPKVKEEFLKRLQSMRERGVKLLAVEAALLIEEHYDAFCDEMWYIYADEATRYRRLASSRGYDDVRIRRTMARQLSEEEFRSFADVTIVNSGDFSDTASQIDVRLAALGIFGE